MPLARSTVPRHVDVGRADEQDTIRAAVRRIRRSAFGYDWRRRAGVAAAIVGTGGPKLITMPVLPTGTRVGRCAGPATSCAVTAATIGTWASIRATADCEHAAPNLSALAFDSVVDDDTAAFASKTFLSAFVLASTAKHRKNEGVGTGEDAQQADFPWPGRHHPHRAATPDHGVLVVSGRCAGVRHRRAPRDP